MNTVLVRGVMVGFLVVPLASSAVQAQGLSDAEAALLTEMDGKTLADVLDLCRQMDGWRKDISQLRKSLKAAGNAPNDPKATAAAADAVLKMARRLQTCSPYLREQIAFDDKIAPLLKRLKADSKAKLSRDDLTNLDSVLDRITALRNPAQFASDFIQKKLKDEYFKKPYTVGGFTFQIDQKDFSTSVFSDKADIAIIVTQADTGATVKAHGLYFKYKFPIPEPVISKLKFDTPGVDDLIKLVINNLPKIGPISRDKDVPVTVDHDKDGKVSKTHFGIRMDFTELKEAGLSKLSINVKVAVTPSGKVDIEKAKGEAKVKLPTPIPLGQTTLLITDVIVGLSDKNEIKLGMTIATVAGGDSTLYADITATIGFPIDKKGLTLEGYLRLNQDPQPIAHVKGTINKDGLTVSGDSDAITGGTGKLTFTGPLTPKGLDASIRFDSLYGLTTAQGTLHLGTDGNGSLTVWAKESVGVAAIDASFGSSFTPGFKNLVFKGAVSIDLGDPYLTQATAEVDISGQLLPSPQLTATGHVGPITLGPITAPDFSKLIVQLKKALLDARQQFYKFLADAESNAAKYADQPTQVFAGWIYQNAKSIGLDRAHTGNQQVDKALGELSQGLKDGGGTIKQVSDAVGGYASDKTKQGEGALAKADPSKWFANGPPPMFLTGISAPRSAKLSSGANGGFGLRDFSIGKDIGGELSTNIQKWGHFVSVASQLAPLTNALDQIVVHRETSNHVGQIAGLRIRTARVLPHPNGDHDADVSFLVQVTSFRYTLDPKKGLVGKIDHKTKLYVVGISLHNLVGKGRKPTAEINLPTFDNVSPWNAMDLLRDELRKRMDARLGDVQLTDRFDERRLLLQNLTDEPITAHVQIETKVGASWRWLPAGPGSSMKSWQVMVPAHKAVPVVLGNNRTAQGRTARIWASSASGRVWIPYATHDVVLVGEKDEAGQTRYYGRSLQNFLFWFSAPKAKTTTLHERLVSVRNQTRYPVLVTAEVAVRNDHGKLEWQAIEQPTRIQPESTVPLHHLHNLPLRGTAVRFRAEDEKKQNLRWVSTWEKPSGQVDAKGYSAAALGTALLVLEPPPQRSFSAGSSTTPNITLHFPAEQVLLPAVKNMPLQKAKKLLEDKGFRVVSGPAAGDPVIAKQVPDAGWQRYGTVVRLATNSSQDAHLKEGHVPHFKNMTLAHAQEEGAHLHLIVKAKNVRNIPTRVTKDRALVGKSLIESQEPAAETKSKPNEVIEVALVRYVAEKPTKPSFEEHVLVPSFKNMALTDR